MEFDLLTFLGVAIVLGVSLALVYVLFRSWDRLLSDSASADDQGK